MFNNVSWSEYLTFISVAALIWYAFVFYTYYRHDLFQTLQGKKLATVSIPVKRVQTMLASPLDPFRIRDAACRNCPGYRLLTFVDMRNKIEQVKPPLAQD